MKKLLIATDNFLPRWDGVARFLAEIIPQLRKEYEITVISPDYGSSPLDKLVKRVRIPTGKQRYGDYTPAEWRLKPVREAVRKADVIFLQTLGPIGLMTHWYAQRFRKPRAAFIHSIEWELVPRALGAPIFKKLAYPVTKFFARLFYNSCDLLIVPSENIADNLRWEHIKTKKKVVHLGVHTDRFVKGDRAAARAKLGLSQKAMIIGFHGRLGREKNLLTLSRAFLRVKHPEKRLLIVGEGTSRLKRRLGRIRGVQLAGAKNDVIPWLQAMDVYVMPSYTETTSLAVLEAMSCELPVVSSKVGFIQQYITDGENGYFFSTKNAFELSVKLQFLIDDKQLRKRIGTAARKTVIHGFDWKITAEKIGKALHSLS